MAYLQQVTGALADTRTSADVFRIVLGPVLGAISSILLLADAAGERMGQVESWGLNQGEPPIWQVCPLGAATPATDVFRTQQPMFFEGAGDLIAAYPNLEMETGATAAVASAVLPMFLNGRPLGTLVLDFKDPHHFTPDEIRFLLILAAQVAIALGRVRLLEGLEQRVQERTVALDAFVRYAELADGETDVYALAQNAVNMLGQLLPGSTSGYYVLEDGLWKVKVHSADLHAAPGLLALVTDGLAQDTPVFAALQLGAPVFIDGWDAQQGQIEQSEAYHCGAAFPLVMQGSAQAVFTIGLKGASAWTDAERAIVRSLARSLALALERSEQARVLKEQNRELEAHTQALEAVASLATDLSLDGDVYALIRRAQHVALSLLPGGFSVYYEPENDLWRSRAQVGDLGNPALQDAVDAGLPFETTLNLKVPWTTGEAQYQDFYAANTDGLDSLAQGVWTTATLPLRVG